jgi:hypothetical protein
MMDWFKKHVDTVIVLTGILGAVLWMNSQFNGLKQDMAIVKTVLIIKNIMPTELAKETK